MANENRGRRRRERRDRSGRERAGRERDGPRRRRRPAEEGSTARSELWEWVKTLGLTLVLLLVIRTFLVQTFVITSGSMEDTLMVGDFLMVNRVAFGTRIPGTERRTPGYSEVRRGDILVFDPAHEDRMKLVKRVVGMPGDTLAMRDKQLYLNGVPQDEPWVSRNDPAGDDGHPWMAWQRTVLLPEEDPEAYRPTRDNWGPLVVPADSYFMLGDNRDFSLDSRHWGVIERWRVEGRAMFFYFSYDRDSTTPLAFLREVRWDRIGRWIR